MQGYVIVRQETRDRSDSARKRPQILYMFHSRYAAEDFFRNFLANSYPSWWDSNTTVYNEAQKLEEFHIVENGNDEGMIWIDTAQFEDKCEDV